MIWMAFYRVTGSAAVSSFDGAGRGGALGGSRPGLPGPCWPSWSWPRPGSRPGRSGGSGRKHSPRRDHPLRARRVQQGHLRRGHPRRKIALLHRRPLRPATERQHLGGGGQRRVPRRRSRAGAGGDQGSPPTGSVGQGGRREFRATDHTILS